MRTLLTSSIALIAATAAVPCSAQVAAPQSLLVSGFTSAAVHTYAEADGTPLGKLGPDASAPGAQSLRYGPDGNLYAAAEVSNAVLRFDGATGQFLGPFVADDPLTPVDESGGLDNPTAAVFGPDGDLYVGNFDADNVLRFDGATGQFLGVFVPAGSGGLNGPDAGMTFGPDGHLYVPSFNNNRVLRYDGASGAFLDVFVAPTEGNLSRPRMLRFRGDGSLFVTSWGNARVLRYDLAGVFQGVFASAVPTPTGLVFAPDSGDVLVTSDNANTVRVLDDLTGAALGTLVPAGSGGLVGGTFVEFFPDRELHLARPVPFGAGQSATLAISNATPGATIYVLIGTAGAASVAGPCAHDWIGVANPVVVPLAADARGALAITGVVPAAAAGATFFLQVFELATCRSSELVVVEA